MRASTPDWDDYFLGIAEVARLKSKDPSTQVGAVIISPPPSNAILSIGYNDFPRGVISLGERWERPEKYEWVVHAEQNAILNAARQGVALCGSWLYVEYNVPPCHHCMRSIIQAGITKVICGYNEFPGVGKGKFYDLGNRTEQMADEANIEIVRLAQGHRAH